MRSSARRILVVLAALVAGVAVGYLLGSAQERDLAPELVPTRGAPSPDRTTPVLSGRSDGRAAAPTDPGVAGDSDHGHTASGRPGDELADTGARLEVRVTDAEGRSVRADVYAVPAGVPGLDYADVPTAYHIPPGPCRLHLPVEGTYDVFVRSQQQPYGAAERKGVLVRRGETVSLDFAYAEGLPIHLVSGASWPVAALLRSGRLRASIGLQSTRQGELPFPTLTVGVQLRPPEGPWQSPPLPPSLRFRAYPWLSVPEAHREGQDGTGGYRLYATPETARPGDTVTLQAERLALLRVRPRLRTPEAWPEGPIVMDFVFEDGDGRRPETVHWRSPTSVRRREHPLVFGGRAGPARLAWDGQGIAPGSLEQLRLDPQRPVDVEIGIQLDAKELPSQEPLVVHVQNLGEAQPGNDEDYLEAAALLPSDDEDGPTALEWGGEPTPELELDYGWRRAGRLVVWRGTFQVSRPTPIPPRGSMDLTMERAGMLVVAPSRLLGEGMSRLKIRRTDGEPFLVYRDLGEQGLRLSTPVFPGDLVGPLPPGRHVFEVHLSGRRLPDAAAVVTPGRVDVLHIDW